MLWQSDWSRGGDAIVARRGISKVADLKGKKIALAPMTPSHTFLIWLLDAAGMTMKDVTLVQVPSAIDAADAFKSGSADAAVVWSPDDAICVEKVPGSRVLESTKNATHIIADVFIAKRDFIQAHREDLEKLYEGWMIGAAEINKSDASKQKAAQILAEGLGQPVDFCLQAINNVRLATHGDNLNFYGMNPDYRGVTGEDLYTKMKDVYHNLGYADANLPSWRLIANKSIVSSTKLKLNDPSQDAEVAARFTKATEEDSTKEAYASKQISVTFRTGEYLLDENAKYIIDKEFTDIAKAFSNARVRIEGNTDNVGSRKANQSLSLLRAKEVARYLSQEYGMDLNRFIIIGNGPDKPIATNSSDNGRAQNRRTDFELISQ